jgi:SpoVK/Ycf46/Vps4 family AAA+-type ATPase
MHRTVYDGCEATKMATADQLKSLFRSYSEGDGEHFVSVALQIAAHAARSGKGKLAQELRDLVDDIKQKHASGRVGGSVPITLPRGELAGLLAVTYPRTRLAEMVLSEETDAALAKTVIENRQQATLRSHGLSARRKLLLVGPPGCGKTMTASALAGELKLPLFAVQLHGLITKFMGETAAKLHMIFEAIRETRGVYFFDEFDAIGANRGSSNDVGEIRRVLNSFLQFLEQDESDSLILAATNFVGMLDDALFRRFDDVVRYSFPEGRQVDELVRNRLATLFSKRPNWESVREASEGLSHADIARACDDAAKACILNKCSGVRTPDLVDELRNRRRWSRIAVGEER